MTWFFLCYYVLKQKNPHQNERFRPFLDCKIIIIVLKWVQFFYQHGRIGGFHKSELSAISVTMATNGSVLLNLVPQWMDQKYTSFHHYHFDDTMLRDW